MLFLTLWLLVLMLEKSIASKHRSVNLALETVLQFDKVDDINIINKVQDFLSHIQGILDKKQVRDNVATRRKKNYQFTDFVEDLVTTLNSFEDNDLKQIFRIVDKDFRTQRVDKNLIDDNVRRFLSHKLTEIINLPAINIRRDLDRILRELRADKNKENSFILDFLNSLYKRNSERKLSKLIKRLNLFLRSARKSKVVLKSIIEKIVNDVIYEHYNNLKDSEKGYIKKFVKAYLIDYIPTDKELNIKQRAKETEITQESIITNESKPIKQITAIQWTSTTSKEIPKKLFTHITLYPKSIKVKKIPIGVPSVAIIESTPTNKENANDKRKENTKETHEIFTNQSVEINVNLLLQHSQDLQNPEDSQTEKSFRAKSPNKIFLRTLKKSIKNKKTQKSSSPALSIETFGSLYRSKTPKRYGNKKKTRLVTYNGKTTMKDKYFKSTNVHDIVKEKSVVKKMPIIEDFRRFNKPTNLIEEKFPKSNIKGIVTTTQHSLTTRALVSHIISTKRLTTPIVTTYKSTPKTTQNVVFNEIFDNDNVTDFKEVTKKPLVKRIRTTTKFVPIENNTEFENDSNNLIINETTVSQEPTFGLDINNFIKNSEVLTMADEEKKKQIEEKMRADLGNLLESSTNATTESVTDIFKELEDAFEI